MPIPALLAAALPGLLAGGTSLVNSLIQSKTAKRNTDATNAANRSLAEYSYSKDLEMWNKANEYNSPTMQMQRLKEAGLNPNMIYGSGSAAGNTSGTLPRYNAPTMQYNYQPLQLPNLLSMYQDFQVKQAQIDNIRAAAHNTEAKTATEQYKAIVQRLAGEKAEYMKADKSPSWSAWSAERNIMQSKESAEFSRADLMNTQRQLAAQLKTLNDQQIRYKEKAIKGLDITNQQKTADLIFSEFRNEWYKMGVTSSDNILVRVLARMAAESGLNLNQMREGIKNNLNSLRK